MFVLALVLAAAPPAPDPIGRLVEQLGAEDQEERDDASDALKQVGARAYPHLARASRSHDLEVRRRARVLIKVLVEATRARAADRRVLVTPAVLKYPGGECHCTPSVTGGVILRREGRDVLVLASRHAFNFCSGLFTSKAGGVIGWKGKEYPLRIVYFDEDLEAKGCGFTLLAFRCDAEVAELPLASGKTRGVWSTGICDAGRTFTEDPKLYEWARPGEGVFTLRESDGALMLAGLDNGGVQAAPRNLDEVPVPGAAKIRKFLDAYEKSKRKPKGKSR
jgi:hypothetical protein